MSDNENLCEEMKELRMASLPLPPDKEKAGSEEKYREELISYYKQMEKCRYEYVVKNETMKVYNVCSKDVVANKIFFKRSGDLLKDPGYEAVKDTAVIRAPILNDRSGKKWYVEDSSSCAITATAINEQVCVEMGVPSFLDGKGNPCNAAAMNTEYAKNYINTKAGQEGPEQERFQQIRNINNGRNRQKSAGQLISEGCIQPGDSFGISVGLNGEDLSRSGSHAMTLVDVTRDKNGEVIGYTLQANNSLNFSYHSISDMKDKKNLQVVTNIVPLSAYANENIEKKAVSMGNLSTEELEKLTSEAENKTKTVISKLKDTEVKNLETKCNYISSDGYNIEMENKKVLAEQRKVEGFMKDMQFEAQSEVNAQDVLDGMNDKLGIQAAGQSKAVEKQDVAESMKNDKDNASALAEERIGLISNTKKEEHEVIKEAENTNTNAEKVNVSNMQLMAAAKGRTL